MSNTAVIPDPDAGVRWRNWQARGAANDRRTAARMRKLILLVVVLMMVWFVVVQLT